MIRNFMNWDLRNDGKNVQDVKEVKLTNQLLMYFLYL